jgi:hypothetical protein
MSTELAEQLNLRCGCTAQGDQSHAAFYSDVPVFVSAAHVTAMRRVITAVHAVTALPAYRQVVLAAAPPITRVDPGTYGAFAGFDFHVGADGPKLIEINTNAGGALLNTVAEWRRPACCGADGSALQGRSRAALEQDFVAMFRQEWRMARGDRVLRTLAIVDDQPEAQFLYPEFLLFADLFARHGIDAHIVNAADLELMDGKLTHRRKSIDMVYNRVTDFYFDQQSHAALRLAHESGAAVITPHPRAHALFADKRNLARLTDSEFLQSVGARQEEIAVLQSGIPQSRLVADDQAWWQDRKQWFFKPASGFGSRGAYRGDKLTRRVFAEVIKGGYVAQRLAVPGQRRRTPAIGAEQFKVDLRHYVYQGRTQLMAARLYQGQTTNFRTPGGGFAPVLEVGDDMASRAHWQDCLTI